MDAPERIWAWWFHPGRRSDVISGGWFSAPSRDDVAYARADLLTAAEAEAFALAAWQCVFTDGQTGIVCDEHGHQFCAMERRAKAAEAEREAWKAKAEAALAQIEMLKAVIHRTFAHHGYSVEQINDAIDAAVDSWKSRTAIAEDAKP